MSVPRVVVGMPTYNGAAHLREAIESLLIQRDADLRLVVVDDCSDDGTSDIAERYASVDERISVHRNLTRLGMTANWRHAFTLGRELHGASPYFMWASDHDAWHPRFVGTLSDYLDNHPEAVAAYPLAWGVFDDGVVIREPREFSTAGMQDRWRRMAVAHHGMTAGYMVYGMYRANALAACGVYRTTLLPDRLLLTELSALGELHQVPEVLWLRRFRMGERPSFARQRAGFWPDGAPPWAYLPWWLTHPAAIMSAQVVRGTGAPLVSRTEGLELAGAYLGIAASYAASRRYRRTRQRLKRRRRAMQAEAKLIMADLRPVGVRALKRHPRTRVAVWAVRGAWRLSRQRIAGSGATNPAGARSARTKHRHGETRVGNKPKASTRPPTIASAATAGAEASE
jgi:hypothetical protein